MVPMAVQVSTTNTIGSGLNREEKGGSGLYNEHGTIYAISSDFGDRMTTQSMGLIVLLSEH